MTSAVDIAAELLGPLAERDAPLGALTTYRVGGSAALLAEADSEADLASVAAAIAASGVEVVVLGKGSNMLVADGGFAGLALILGPSFAVIDRLEGDMVRAGGSTSLPVLARRTAAMGLTGLEWAVGVPGSVGGAVRMNAGGHGADVAASLVEARVVDLAGGGDAVLGVADLDLAYRHSSIGRAQVVVWATFQLAPGDHAHAEAQIDEVVRWRREHQPGGQNAGSVFTNPEGDSAGRLVDAAGLKGFTLGSAQVSPKHANFIQAEPGGSADDVLALIRHVQRRVEEDLGVRLEPEVRLVGFGP